MCILSFKGRGYFCVIWRRTNCYGYFFIYSFLKGYLFIKCKSATNTKNCQRNKHFTPTNVIMNTKNAQRNEIQRTCRFKINC